MSEGKDMRQPETKISADEVRDADPSGIMNIHHTRGLQTRGGGEKKLLNEEVDQPALTIEDGIYMADGKPISKAEFMRYKGGGGD